MGAKDGDRPFGHLVQLLDEDRALALKVVNHVPIMDDFVAHVDRLTKFGQGLIHDIDGREPPPCAKAARLRQHHFDHPHTVIIANSEAHPQSAKVEAALPIRKTQSQRKFVRVTYISEETCAMRLSYAARCAYFPHHEP